ncbi:MAG: sulfatase-like hydrolase/transferase [Candidatus Woesearchaeota archaeon]
MKELLDPNHNVLFITLDCCRFDTYTRANTPTLDKIGKARLAQTVGNFTYPAHCAFFIGQLPTVRDKSGDDFFTKEGRFLWKVKSASVKRDAGVQFEGYTIQQGYRKKGYAIRGFGGATFFSHPGEQLRSDYKDGEFVYFGNSTSRQPRSIKTLPLQNIDKIVDSIKNTKRWFLFINETATHCPYHLKSTSSKIEKLMNYATQFKGGRLDPECRFNYENGGKELHQLQIDALEWVDKQLGKLLTRLPNKKPLLVVITGDHGDSFGENGYWGHVHNAPEVLNVPLIINPNYVHM